LHLTVLERRFGDQDARALEHRSRCVMIADRGYRARSADMVAGHVRRDGSAPRAEL
jgi:hypothetical protein